MFGGFSPVRLFFLGCLLFPTALTPLWQHEAPFHPRKTPCTMGWNSHDSKLVCFLLGNFGSVEQTQTTLLHGNCCYVQSNERWAAAAL